MWTVYRIVCETPNTVYIGVTQDPLNRWKKHEKGQGSAWTRLHGYQYAQIICTCATESAAKRAERLHVIRDRYLGRNVGGAGDTATI